MNTLIISASLVLVALLIVMLRTRGKFKRNLIRLLDSEWNTWGRQLSEDGHLVIIGSRETDEPFVKRVGEFWKSEGYSYDGTTHKSLGVQFSHLIF